MKKIVFIFTVLMVATPATANVTPNLNVATTSFVQGAVATKQDVIDASHKLSADLVDDSATTNKFVTASDKTTWNAKQAQLQNDAGSPANVSATVKTTVAAVSSASDTSLATEKAVRTAIDTASTVTQTGDTYGSITAVTNANGGIQVTRGATQVQIKSNNAVTGAATMWIE